MTEMGGGRVVHAEDRQIRHPAVKSITSSIKAICKRDPGRARLFVNNVASGHEQPSGYMPGGSGVAPPAGAGWQHLEPPFG